MKDKNFHEMALLLDVKEALFLAGSSDSKNTMNAIAELASLPLAADTEDEVWEEVF